MADNRGSDGWGGGGQNNGPDLDKTIKELKEWASKMKGFGKSWVYVLVALVLLWGATGIYIVNPDEQAVVRRFGAMSGISESGMHYRIPWPVDKVDKAKVAQIRSMELGFRTAGRSNSRGRIIPKEALMITGDENIVNLMVVVQYQISDLPAYLFKVWDPEGTPEGRTLRDAAETALRGVVGSMTIDEILTTGRAKVQDSTKVHLQQLLNLYQSGLFVTEVKLQAVEPPEQVQASFKDVVSAKEDRERIINEAKAYQEDLIPKARGEAEKMIRSAEGYRESRVAEAKGESNKFLAMLREYRQAKDITRQRLYLETMGEVLSKVDKTIISRSVGGKTLPYLPLGSGGVRSGKTK